MRRGNKITVNGITYQSVCAAAYDLGFAPNTLKKKRDELLKSSRREIECTISVRKEFIISIPRESNENE